MFSQIWRKQSLHALALGDVGAHSLLWAAGLEVAHRDEVMLQSFFGGDSLTPVNIKGLFQEIHKNQTVQKLTLTVLRINLKVEGNLIYWQMHKSFIFIYFVKTFFSKINK